MIFTLFEIEWGLYWKHISLVNIETEEESWALFYLGRNYGIWELELFWIRIL
jgi:hypothetical protein